MTRIIHAELLRLVRRRTMLAAAVGVALFAVVAALSVLSSAQETVNPSQRGSTTLAELAEVGGGTVAFAVGASFVGFFVFVIFIALIAGEFSGGTFRSLLLRNPHRMQVITGKLAGIFLVAAVLVALAEVLTFGLSLALAPSQDIATANWFTFDSLGAALRDYATVLGGVAGWAVFGTTLAVVFRSVPLALGVGFAWAGPFENIVVDSWSTGYRVFPGQVLGAMIRGGWAELGLGRAVLTATLYAAGAAVTALILVSRRDVAA